MFKEPRAGIRKEPLALPIFSPWAPGDCMRGLECRPVDSPNTLVPAWSTVLANSQTSTTLRAYRERTWEKGHRGPGSWPRAVWAGNSGLGWGMIYKGAGASRWAQPCGPVDLQIFHPMQKRAKVGLSKVGSPGQGPGLPMSESIRAS